ncbi:hypothetical protein FQR65_LT14055 [Abscondita terminalis]|nr:hypothetical protein FQR65_LT14055 [Abscondita terminalis]
MFKIVQTIEKGKKQLTIVPTAWESNGILWWPKFGAERLAKIPDCVPEENWFSIKCELKRDHLLNYSTAESELERMLDYDDTESEFDGNVQRTMKRPRVHLPKKRNENDDFNGLAKSCLLQEKILLHESRNEAAHDQDNVNDTVKKTKSQKLDKVNNSTITNNQLYLELTQTDELVAHNNNDLRSLYLPLDNESLTDTNSNSTLIIEKLDKILTNQTIIMENQNVLLQSLASKEVQEKVAGKLGTIQTTLDTLVSNINFTNSQTIKNCRFCEKRSNSSDETSFNIIETYNDVENFERILLSDKTKLQNYVEKFSYICGKKGNGNGLNNCYLLVDRIFSRKFMTLCSWAGGARDNKEKIAFKMFKNTIHLFFQIINMSDETFTLKDCEEFFKNVIRNSKKRHESSMLRTSKTKRRPNNLSYKERLKVTQLDKESSTSRADDEKGITSDVRSKISITLE